MKNAERAYRQTRQRQIILQELRHLRTHPTADELFEIVRQRLPRISLATVYRNLELLAEQGLIQKLEPGGHQRHYDGRIEPHYHIRCVQCDAVADLELKEKIELAQPNIDIVQPHTEYQVLDCYMEFTGICPRCRKQQQNNSQDTIADKEN